MLATLLEPTAGSASVAGFDVVRSSRQVRRNLGVLFAGERGMYWRLSGRENLELFGTLSFMPRQLIQDRIQAAARQFGLQDRMDDLVETYSTGMKQRLNLARATLHEPPVLLLDEPTAALDPVAAREARHLIRQIAESGTAILLTTHNLYEAEQICDRVGIIQSGTLVAEGRPADLIRQAGEAPRLDLLLRGDLATAKATIGFDGSVVGRGEPRRPVRRRRSRARGLAQQRRHHHRARRSRHRRRGSPTPRARPGRRLYRHHRITHRAALH